MRWLLHLKAVWVAFTSSHSVYFFKAIFIAVMTRGGQGKGKDMKLWVHPDKCKKSCQRLLTQVLTTEVHTVLCSIVMFCEANASVY